MRTALTACCLVLPLILTGPAAQAAVDEKKIAAARKASAEFIKLGRDAHKTGNAPRESDPKVKALLDAVFDTSALGTAEFDDLPKVNPWMLDAVNVSFVYMLAGTGTNDIRKAAASPKAIERLNKNIVTFDAEYGRYIDFQLALSGFVLDGVRAKMETASEAERKNPKFQAGFAQISGGVAQTISGALTTFVTEGVTAEWQRARLGPLMAIATKASKTIPKADREKMREIALEVSDASTDPQVKSGVKEIADALIK